jgi:hypothetical protein
MNVAAMIRPRSGGKGSHRNFSHPACSNRLLIRPEPPSFLRHKLAIKNDADPLDVFPQVHILNPVKNGEINLVGKQQVVQFFLD